jgi:hypothetical protein
MVTVCPLTVPVTLTAQAPEVVTVASTVIVPFRAVINPGLIAVTGSWSGQCEATAVVEGNLTDLIGLVLDGVLVDPSVYTVTAGGVVHRRPVR